ncbi:hypothetical protein [Nocardioides massiliensis]|uniref:Uncharacterized protein n=1 Tax=Nocardioides massiliensis TaxID=1325935 RepID=A0ABT9NJH4_9ACTN|nr:hypothetical protein [Nocardioides massiliensis]MDP9820501.1 hypothetical protein [Nocardioides massiliensis]
MSKFKVGDRVRVNGTFPDDPDQRVVGCVATVVGCVATVVEGHRGSKYIRANLANLGETWLFLPGELDRISTEFKLDGGEIIRNTRTDKTGIVYTDGDGVRRIRYVEPTLVSDDVKASAVEEYEHHYPGTYEVLSGVPA